MNARRTPRALLVFGRDPRPGRVKTRLIPALGATGAADLYWRMLQDTLATAATTVAEIRELWVDSAAPTAELVRLAVVRGLTVRTQRGSDLGRRMANALAAALHEPRRAVLIGSDCPGYTPGYLAAAFDALLAHDAVIGPAVDGGYVLIGLNAPQPALFEQVAWGTGSVLDSTRQRLHDLDLSWYELPTLRDLDDPADLACFPNLAASAEPAHSVREAE